VLKDSILGTCHDSKDDVFLEDKKKPKLGQKFSLLTGNAFKKPIKKSASSPARTNQLFEPRVVLQISPEDALPPVNPASTECPLIKCPQCHFINYMEVKYHVGWHSLLCFTILTLLGPWCYFSGISCIPLCMRKPCKAMDHEHVCQHCHYQFATYRLVKLDKVSSCFPKRPSKLLILLCFILVSALCIIFWLLLTKIYFNDCWLRLVETIATITTWPIEIGN